MNNKYFKLRLFQSAFLLFFTLGMSMTAFAQSGSGSGSGSNNNSGDCCDQGGKPEQITFRYVGGSCSSSTDSQGSKFECDGGSATAGSVYIEIDDFFDGTVNLGETFTIDSDGDKFSSATEIIIRSSQGGSRLQTLDFHTSCSAPIVPGEQFGALLLERVVFDNGLVCTPPAPPETCPTPTINTPTSPITSTNGNFCTNQPVTFSAPDLGFPCLEYTWNFGAGASPQTFVGNGPINVTFSTLGSRQVSLTIDNNCTDDGNTGNNSGSGSSGSGSSGSGSGSNNSGSGSGSSGSGSSSGSGGNFVNLVICPQGGVNNNSGSGSSGSGSSGSGSSSNNSGSGSGSSGSGSSGSGSGSNNNGGNGNEACVPCRRTVNITINVENCNQPNPSMIGDMVFNDLNGNGIMNNGEPGISGVIVTLSKDNGQFIGQATSDFFGKYKFNNVMPNMSYKLTYTNLPAGFSFAPQNQGGNEDNDSDANQSTGMTDPIFINPGDMRLDQDVGLVQGNPNQATVGDKVFADNNGNGIQNNGEPGIGGVTVKLQDSNGNTLQETTTSGDGSYSFTGLTQGLYKVMFNTPNGFVITMPKQGGNDETDSDVQNNQMTNPFFVGEGQTLTNIDAGYVPNQPNNGTVGDRVFADNNNNGQQDGNEPGLSGVTVKLQDTNGNTLQTTTTDGNGNYQFTNVTQGSYQVMVNVPNGFTPSPMNIGNDNTDNDIGANGMTNVFFLSQGQNDPTIDAGLFPDGPTGGKASVGDMAFRDNNGNGIMEQGEPGVQGVYVQLNDGNGNFLKFTTTDQNGKYKFTDLDPGRYQLKLVGQPADLIPSPQDEGSDNTQDSDINLLGFTDFFDLNAGDNNLTLDAGFSPRDAVPQNCSLNASVSNFSCDGNTYSFDVTVNGSNAGDWGWDLPEAGIYTQSFGSTRRITGVSGTKTFVIVDHDVAGCETTITVNPPSGCDDSSNTGGETGTCSDINISGSNGQVTISGLTAAIEITKIFDASWNLIYECSGNCPNTVQESVSNGDYNVQVQFYTAQWGFICEKQESVTVGGSNNGGGDNGGGDNGGGNNGGGDSSGGDCNNINVQSGNGQITVSGWSAPVAIVKIFNPDYSLAKECTGKNCTGPISATGLAAGRYHIDIQLYTAGWQAICSFTQDVNMGGSSLIAPNTGTGLNLTNNNALFSVYPNPATDELFVNMKEFVGQQGTIQIHNQIGQVVQQMQLNNIPFEALQMNVSGLEGGLYYVSAHVAGHAIKLKKVIIE